MIEVFTSGNISDCYLIKTILDGEGIECEITNESIQQIIPQGKIWPKVEIKKKDDFENAMKLIEKYKPIEDTTPSFCPRCDSEKIELEEKGSDLVFNKYKCIEL